jgi:hypothetical protein
MKAKVNRGNGFRGLLDYAMGEEKKHEIVATNMAGDTPRELAAEFKVARQLRPEVKNPVVQFSLSLPPGEDVSAETWGLIAEDFLKAMAFDTSNHQYVAPKHNDTVHKHIHVIGSRIGLDGSLWHGKFDVFTAIEATQMLEKKYGLTLTAGLNSVEAESHKAKPSKGQLERSIRTGDAPVLTVLQTVIDEALADSPTTTAFLERLDAAGVTAVPNVASTGTMNGFSFGMDGVFFKGKQLGDSYTWKQLQTRGLSYDKDRESGELIRRKEQAAAAKSADGERDPGASPGTVEQPVAVERRGPENSSGVAEQPEQIVGRRGNRENGIDDSIDQQRQGAEQGSDTPGGGEQPQPKADPVRDQHERLRDWSRVAADAADLAAPLAAKPVEGVSSPVTKALQAKQKAWNRQADALGAPSYRITMIGRRDGLSMFNQGKKKDGSERFYTKDEVAALLPKLSRDNGRGFDVYVTPIDPQHHYIVVDDMRDASMKQLMADGFKPCLVQESSHENWQAIIKIPKAANEQSQANTLVSELNRQYGDPKFSGVVHPFRMAGFSNKKPGRDNAFTRVVEAVHRVCSKAAGMFQAIKDRVEKATAKTVERYDRERQILVARTATGTPRDVVDAFRRAYARNTGLAESKGWTIDASRLDWASTIDLLKGGYSPQDVAGAMQTASPEILDRHNDPSDYATRTVSNALAEPEVVSAMKRRAEAKLLDAMLKPEDKQTKKPSADTKFEL